MKTTGFFLYLQLLTKSNFLSSSILECCLLLMSIVSMILITTLNTLVSVSFLVANCQIWQLAEWLGNWQNIFGNWQLSNNLENWFQYF